MCINNCGKKKIIEVQGPQGQQGDPGSTPEIIDGVWHINGESTGISATGPAGPAGSDGTGVPSPTAIPIPEEQFSGIYVGIYNKADESDKYNLHNSPVLAITAPSFRCNVQRILPEASIFDIQFAYFVNPIVTPELLPPSSMWGLDAISFNIPDMTFIDPTFAVQNIGSGIVVQGGHSENGIIRLRAGNPSGVRGSKLVSFETEHNARRISTLPTYRDNALSVDYENIAQTHFFDRKLYGFQMDSSYEGSEDRRFDIVFKTSFVVYHNAY